MVTRANPNRAYVRRSSPIAGAPYVTWSGWIPIAINPGITGPGIHRRGVGHNRRRRSIITRIVTTPDSYADENTRTRE